MKTLLIIATIMFSSMTYAEQCNTYCTEIAGSTTCQTVCTK